MAPFRPPPPTPLPFSRPQGLGKVQGLALGYVAFGGILLMGGLTFAALALFVVSRDTRDASLPLGLFVTEAVLMTSLGVMCGLAALSLWTRRHPVFLRVAAGLVSIVFPFGTLLAVLTFMWLDRADVRSLFEARSPR